MLTMSSEANVDLNMTGKLGVLPSSFQGDSQAGKAVGKIVGVGGKHSWSPFYRGQDTGGGKVRPHGARDQSLRNFFAKDTKSTALPQLKIFAAKGRVGLEVMSWADNIVRTFKETKEDPAADRHTTD